MSSLMSTPRQAQECALPATPADSIRVRPASRPDRGSVRRLECACFGWARLLFGLWPRAGRPGVETWIAEMDGRPAGYLISYEKALGGQPVWYVGSVGVLPEFRQRGVGTRLMQAALAAHGSLWLHVRAGNTAALCCYRKLHMQEIDRLPRYYSNGEDAVVMATAGA
jgi:[ribosomal protein S18]-alanine N-acetyltransferase